MATITTSQYLEDAARTAGEAHAIGNGAVLTIRTDTRVHANAPASFTGSLGNPTFTDIGGELSIDATAVRWLAYDTGSGNVPAIGTSVVQGSVSGYLLGVWDSLSSGPTAVGAAMPADGFIKLREVTNGPYTTGALTNIGASATAADVTGWIECAFDTGTNFVVGRVGKIKSRGTWFYLADTDGTVGQQIQVPSSSATATNNYCPGVWVETEPASGVYEFWPGLASSAVGWNRNVIGYAEGYTDKRGQYVKTFGSGLVQFGETETRSATYASQAAITGTYSGTTVSGTYTWADDVVTVNTGATAHLLETGLVTGLDFTSGGGVDGAAFTVTVIDAYNFTVPYVGSIAGGNVTVRPGVTLALSTHGFNIGDEVYCDFTSGTGVDGTYVVYSVPSGTSALVSYPHAAALTSGNVSTLSTLVVTLTAHAHSVGNEVYCDFTSGGATDGRYIIKAVTTNTFNINYAHTAAIASSNVTLRWTIGHVPESGCKVRIPNILMAECATGSRATNSVPNVTIASRPEFITTSAGAIDLEYLYTWSMRSIFAQPYSVRLYHCALMETLDISECATPLDVDDVGVGTYSGVDARAMQLTSNFAGGTVKNVSAMRSSIGTTDHAAEASFCNGIVFTNIKSGIIRYARSTGIAFNIVSSQNLTFNGLQVFNGNVPIATSVDIAINDLDYNDRNCGRTSSTTPYYCMTVAAGCDNIVLNGVTFGIYGTVDDCHPYTGIFNCTGATNIKVRNLGSSATYLKTGVWAPNLYGMGTIFASGGNNNTVAIQKAFVGKVRTIPITAPTNSDKNFLFEQVLSSSPYLYSVKAAYTTNTAALNNNVRGVTTGVLTTTAQTSCYGTHWFDLFQGDGYGALILVMNEPTAETTAYFTVDAGTVKFNSAGGVEMRAIGAKATWETPYFIQGHTGFQNVSPVMTGGGAISNFRFKYQIDTGSGWSSLSAQKTAAELATALNGETISPTTGFRLKLQIETTSTNTAAITHLRIYTTTTTAAQEAIDYPLDTVPVTVTVLDVNTGDPVENARVLIEADSGGPASAGTDILTGLTNASGVVTGTTEYTEQPVVGKVRRASAAYGTLYKTSPIAATIGASGLDITILLIPDE